jgi:cytochrome c oxidase cbb3-type subunit 3
MRYRRLLECVALLAMCLASGTLECGRPQLTAEQSHGQELYVRMCAVCHGRSGAGYVADQAPAIAHPDFLATANDEYLRAAIAIGRGGTTMSAWSSARGGPLSATDVTAVIAYMRTWQRRPQATLDERPVAGDAGRGAAVYQRECMRCHGSNGTGGPQMHIGNPDLLGSATNGFLRAAISGGRPGTAMPSFGGRLGEAGIDDLVTLLRTWQRTSGPQRTPPARPPPLPLGPVPLNPHGPEPVGFRAQPATTPADVVKAQLDRGARMGLLDARAPSDYSNEHIAGAVSVPFYDPDPYFDKLPRDAWLVCYCACPHAESGQLASKLAAKGFTKVTVLDEGLGVWRARKYPTRAGADP